MKPRFSRLSEIDLAQIADYIARDSSAEARRFVHAVRTKAHTIARQPNAYPVRSHEARTMRRAVLGYYSVWFSVDDEGQVTIQRILHDARDEPPETP